MAFNKSLSISSATATQHIVQRAHFGGDALHRVIISDEAQVMSHFTQSASALGLSDQYRTGAFVLASFFAGISGALLVHYIGTVNPKRFGVHEMVFVLVWAIVGGTSKFYGPILGVVVLTLVNEVALRAIGLDTVRPLIYGIILLGFILFLPNGLESLVPKIISRWKLKK